MTSLLKENIIYYLNHYLRLIYLINLNFIILLLIIFVILKETWYQYLNLLSNFQ